MYIEIEPVSGLEEGQASFCAPNISSSPRVFALSSGTRTRILYLSNSRLILLRISPFTSVVRSQDADGFVLVAVVQRGYRAGEGAIEISWEFHHHLGYYQWVLADDKRGAKRRIGPSEMQPFCPFWGRGHRCGCGYMSTGRAGPAHCPRNRCIIQLHVCKDMRAAQATSVI